MAEEEGDASRLYSLWLMPERGSGTYAQLVATISELTRQANERHARTDVGQGERHDAPMFLPHLTLLGSIGGMSAREVEARVKTLVERLFLSGGSRLRVEMESFGKGAIFHQCVFITAQKSPELMNAHSLAREVMGMPPSTTYMPHVSLVYANLDDQAKDDFIRQLQTEGRVTKEKVSFEAKAIHVWRTDGPEEGWHEIACVPLDVKD